MSDIDLSIIDNNNNENQEIQEILQPSNSEPIQEPIQQPEQSIDDIKLLTKRRLHLQLYLNEFSEELSSFKSLNLNEMSLEEVFNLKCQFDDILNSITPIEQVKQFTFSV